MIVGKNGTPIWRLPISVEIETYKLTFRYPTFDEHAEVMETYLLSSDMKYSDRVKTYGRLLGACLQVVRDEHGNEVEGSIEELPASAFFHEHLSTLLDQVFFRGRLSVGGGDDGPSGPGSRSGGGSGDGEGSGQEVQGLPDDVPGEDVA